MPSEREPTLLSLRPRFYETEAGLGVYAGTVKERVPLVVQAGRTAKAHLGGGWKPHRHYAHSKVVWLPCGGVAGGRAAPRTSRRNRA